MPSNRRKCPHCQAEMPCGFRTCQACGKLLALKERHTKCLQNFRQQAVQWAEKTKKDGNGSKVLDRSVLMMEKMKALGHIPIMMWGKPKRSKAGGWKAEVYFPFKLPTEGIVMLDKLLGLFEGLLQACDFTEERKIIVQMPSNRRKCPHCKAEMPCGFRTCQTCGKLLALKERNTKSLQKFRQQAVQWAEKTKKDGNGTKVVDRSVLMMEKMKALGHIPIMMWGKPKRSKAGGWKSEVYFPFKLPTEGIVMLDKLLGLFEGLLQVCDFTEGEDERNAREMGEVVEEGGMGEEFAEDLGDRDTDPEDGEMVEDGSDKDRQPMAEHEDGEEEKLVKEHEEMVVTEGVGTEYRRQEGYEGEQWHLAAEPESPDPARPVSVNLQTGHTTVVKMPSNRRKCPNCKAIMPCGFRTCQMCGKLLALKERQTKSLQNFRQRAAQWAEKTKKDGNGAKVVDRSVLMMEKMKALGHIPIMMWGKPKRSKAAGWKAEVYFPFKLPTEGIVMLDKLLGLFEGLLQTCDFTEGEDERNTLEIGEGVLEEGEMGEELPEDLWDRDMDGEMGEDGSDKYRQTMAAYEDGEEENSAKEQEKVVETEPKTTTQTNGLTERTPLVEIPCKRARKQKNGDDDQSVDVKINSPDSDRDLAIKQEKPEDISITQEEPEDQPQIAPLHIAVCKEVPPEQEELDPPHIKVEEEELHRRPEETDDGSMTSPAIKGQVDEDVFSSSSQRCFEVEVEIESDTEVTEDSDGLEEEGSEVVVHETPSFQCKLCNKSFSKPYRLKRHQLVHSGEKSFHCQRCDKSFHHSDGLNKHQRVHTGERPFRCTHCDKSFSESCHLNRHQCIHSGEKPFRCERCDKTFARSSDLNRHRRVHTGEKPFRCKYCDRSFSYSYNLTTHQRIHTGEKKHDRVHTGEKTFRCERCGREFRQLGDVMRHQLIHTGEKRFSCTDCEKSFTRSDELKAHQRSVHV